MIIGNNIYRYLMKVMLKTFPKSKIIIFLLSFLTICCNSEKKSPIDKTQFVEVYAGLTIIDELKIPASQKDSLVTDLLIEKQVSREDLKKSMDHFKQNPEEWVDILLLARDRIKEMKRNETPSL